MKIVASSSPVLIVEEHQRTKKSSVAELEDLCHVSDYFRSQQVEEPFRTKMVHKFSRTLFGKMRHLSAQCQLLFLPKAPREVRVLQTCVFLGFESTTRCLATQCRNISIIHRPLQEYKLWQILSTAYWYLL